MSQHTLMKSRGPRSAQEKRANHDRAAEARIRTRQTEQRGAMNRSVLAEFVRDRVEYSYHTTKGWRSRRLPSGAVAMILPEPGLPTARTIKPQRPRSTAREQARRVRQMRGYGDAS